MMKPIKNAITAAVCLIACLAGTAHDATAQTVPRTYDRISINRSLQPVFTTGGKDVPASVPAPKYTFSRLSAQPTGTAAGLSFDFRTPALNGTLVYGFIPYGDSEHPQPVYFKRTATIKAGIAEVDISAMAGKYDMIGWQQKGYGTLGYRIIDGEGTILYDGITGFKGAGPFDLDAVISEGPYVGNPQPSGATIWFYTNLPVRSSLRVNGRTTDALQAQVFHQYDLEGLDPDTEYDYTAVAGKREYAFRFRTAPVASAKRQFTFAYASDSRGGQGGGERSMFGVNAYIVRKIMALASYRNAAFVQFTGDLVDGYLQSRDEINLQYANWKRAVQPWWHQTPVYPAMGNHEALLYQFGTYGQGDSWSVDRFPFERESAEAAFADNFVNPPASLISEDGAAYDPTPGAMDFPPYAESVYSYTYGNTAMIVLNSNYWYAPSLNEQADGPGGNLHGYIMDNQLEWLRQTVAGYERDGDIAHVFVTVHTPAFPNGGHVSDDMWYGGHNKPRPVIAGKPVTRGIIERRDDILDILVNNSTKVLALLTGDEHNYNRMSIDGAMDRYPHGWSLPKVDLRRAIWQINNGAAGAPYYAQEKTPWSGRVEGFTTQNALVLIHVDGPAVTLEVRNPDTLELVDEARLR